MNRGPENKLYFQNTPGLQIAYFNLRRKVVLTDVVSVTIVDIIASGKKDSTSSFAELMDKFNWPLIKPTIISKIVSGTKVDYVGIKPSSVAGLGGLFVLKFNGGNDSLSKPGENDSLNANVLTVSTRKEDMLGVNIVYNNLKLPNSTTYMIPSSDEMTADLTFDKVKQMVDAVDVIYLSGGDDIGPRITGKSDETDLSKFYGVNYARDAIEEKILNEVIDRDDIFFIGVCRGLQFLATELTGHEITPVEVEGHRPADDPVTSEKPWETDHHAVQMVLQSEIREAIDFPDIKRVTSHHHQGIRIDELSPYLERLKEKGWYVALVANEEGVGVVEAMVKVKKDPESGEWIVLGVAIQGHPEDDVFFQYDKSIDEWQKTEDDRRLFNEWLLSQEEQFVKRKRGIVSENH